MFNKFISRSLEIYEFMWKKQKCIVAFPLLQLLSESPTMARHTYIVYLAISCRYSVAEVSIFRILLQSKMMRSC